LTTLDRLGRALCQLCAAIIVVSAAAEAR